MNTLEEGEFVEEIPPQEQDQQPGETEKMTPQPQAQAQQYRGSDKLKGKVALITGGDSGIGRAAAVAFAKEGADIHIVYLKEHEDAEETKRLVEATGQRCVLLAGDVANEFFCEAAVEQCVAELGGINILVNNAAEQHPQESLEDISAEQLERTFRTNIFSMFYLSKVALRHMSPNDTIINTTSVTAYRGSPHLLDYSATKGAIVSFTRSLSRLLAEKGIRVNAVAPGPIWTPLIPATFEAEKVAKFGEDVPMGRPGQPDELAAAYVFLASHDSSYMTGQVMHINGGEIING